MSTGDDDPMAKKDVISMKDWRGFIDTSWCLNFVFYTHWFEPFSLSHFIIWIFHQISFNLWSPPGESVEKLSIFVSSACHSLCVEAREESENWFSDEGKPELNEALRQGNLHASRFSSIWKLPLLNRLDNSEVKGYFNTFHSSPHFSWIMDAADTSWWSGCSHYFHWFWLDFQHIFFLRSNSIDASCYAINFNQQRVKQRMKLQG